MITFLDALAKAYASRWPVLTDICFVMPNRRSGAFLAKSFNDMMGMSSGVAPKIISIADFAEELSGRVVNSRIDLLFTLYDEYRKIIAEGKHSSPLDFDDFRVWGDTLLEDFNDVEMWMVPPQLIFSNIANLREIQSSYLTDEQLAVINEFFGQEHFSRHIHGFWAHYNQPSPPGENKQKFYRLWELMLPLYQNLCCALEERGLTFKGRAFAQALERIKEEGRECIGVKRIVFVGLNALSRAEEEILKACSKLKSSDHEGNVIPFADFYWDIPAPPVDEESHAATHFVIPNSRRFKSLYPDVEKMSRPDKLTDNMELIAAPSNAAQAKIAGEIINQWCKNVPASTFDAGKVAIMLPDENLLYPLLYSLPSQNDDCDDSEFQEGLKSVNLTMGYSFSFTSTYTFLYLYRRLQRRMRMRAGRLEFLREDVDALLLHPYTSIFLGQKKNDVADVLRINRRFTIVASLLTDTSECAATLFRPFVKTSSSDDIISHIIHILQPISSYLETIDSRHLDYSHVMMTAEALRRLKRALCRHNISVSTDSAFSIILKTLSSETIRMQGEPLKGLQIMGPLETRCLDFEYLIVPSMNERIFPKKVRKRSFIPVALRKGYGMDDDTYQESIFAYNFFRLLGRAKKVIMIYDARMGETRSGDPSRYVQQLQHLYARDSLKSFNIYFDSSHRESQDFTLRKRGIINDYLSLYFTHGSGRHFSASSLSSYIGCPMKFCLSQLLNIQEPQDAQDFLSSAMAGNVVHSVMQCIYTPEHHKRGVLLSTTDDSTLRPEVITREYIDAWLKSEEKLDALIALCIYAEENRLKLIEAEKEFKSLTPGLEIYIEPLRTLIANALLTDRAIAPFTIYGTEIKEWGYMNLPDGSQAAYTYIIDRLDFVNTKQHPEGVFRVVDYKTGYTDLNLETTSDLFTNENKKAAFQLALYATLFSEKHLSGAPMDMCIFDLKSYKQMPVKMASVNGSYVPVSSHLDLLEDGFKSHLIAMLDEIRNSEIDFRQCELGSKVCSYCPFRVSICNR